MLKSTLILFILLAFSFHPGKSNEEQKLSSSPTQQKEIIEILSGATTAPNGQIIKNRSSSTNKKLARIYLEELIREAGVEPEIQTYAMPNVNPFIDLFFNPFQGDNIFATLPSTSQSEEYIILGAHYDTELDCPGAIDNATGVALIFEVFSTLSHESIRNKNVTVVFFDQEEEDLVGSQAFAKFIKAKNLDIHSVHTFDTMGWDQDGDQAVELELPTPLLEEVYRKNAEKLGIPIYISPCNSTDHHSFRVKGYNAIGMTDEYYNGDYPPHKDTPSDKFETVNFSYLKSSTELVFNTIKEIIN